MAKRVGKTRRLSERGVKKISKQSGVYNLRNRKGDIIYTGSMDAGRLRGCLQERLRNRHVRGAYSFQIRPFSSIAEARRVEKVLIERNKPRVNKRGK